MVECRRWRKYFLVSLGLHGLGILLISCLGFQITPLKMNDTGEMSIQLVNASEIGMQGSADHSENTAGSLASVSASSLLKQKEASTSEAEGKNRLIKPDKKLESAQPEEPNIKPDDGLEPVQLKKINASNSPISENSVSSSAGAGQNADGQAGTVNQSLQQGSGNGIFSNGNFLSNGDGSYTALNAGGISYTIIRDADVRYPEEARSIGYSRTVSVQARILVGLDGFVESVEILNTVPNLGFKESAIEALRKMQFAPIYYRSHNVKMYFSKKIYFQP